MKVCVLGDQKHCDEANAAGVPCMTADDLKKLNKDKKLIKKLAKSYDAFLASDVLIKQIPRILGPALNKVCVSNDSLFASSIATLSTSGQSLSERSYASRLANAKSRRDSRDNQISNEEGAYFCWIFAFFVYKCDLIAGSMLVGADRPHWHVTR